MARAMQKEEMGDLLADLDDDGFLMELRLNDEFNRLLASGAAAWRCFGYLRAANPAVARRNAHGRERAVAPG